MMHVNLPNDKIPHPSGKADGTYGDEHGDLHVGAERRPSTMRITTAKELETPETKELTESQWALRRRGCFRCLPTGCGNDMILGSWWFVAGSILTVLIPAFPLISLYLLPEKRFWPTAEAFVVPVDDHSAVYALLIGCGIFFVAGSLFLVRAFKEPTPMPFFPCGILATDEVVASWLFFLGTVPTVPLTVIYVAYFPGNAYYIVALVFCVLASLVMLLFTYAVYPAANSFKPYQIVSPVVHKLCCGPTNRFFKHVQNDWLIICWLIFIGALLATIASCAALIYYAKLHNRRGIFDYATGAFDCLLFTIGSAYFIAGSYPVHSEYDEECGGIGVPAFYPEERRRGKDVKIYSEEVPEDLSADSENLWRNHCPEDNNDGRLRGRLPPIKNVSLSSDPRGTFDSSATDPRAGPTRKASKGRSPSIPESASGSESAIPGRRRSLEESFAATSASKFAPRTRSNSPPNRMNSEERGREVPHTASHAREEKGVDEEGNNGSEEEEEKKYDVETNVRGTAHALGTGSSDDLLKEIPMNPFLQPLDDSMIAKKVLPTNPFSG